MSLRTRAGARPVAAPLVAVAIVLGLGLAGCSSSSSTPAASSGSTSPTPRASTSARHTIDPVALQALHRAESVLARTRSYDFTADTTVTAASTLRTHLTGRVVRGQ